MIKYPSLKGGLIFEDKTYINSSRSIWFSVEQRDVSPLWFGTFARDNFKIIRNYTNAVSLTCYHNFYPKDEYKKYIDKLFIFLKSRLAKYLLQQQKRVYGNKLDKLEPNDLNKTLVPSSVILDKISDSCIKSELICIKETNSLSLSAEKQLQSICNIKGFNF